MFMKFLSALSACRPTAAIRKPLSPIWIRASSLYATLKALYARRWGIETSFRSLKYAVGLIHLHAKKPDLVLQEIFASFLIFNFTQAAAWAVDTSQSPSKYKRHVNFSDAVFACCAFLRRSAADPLPLLRRKLLPFRPGRTAPRPKITGNRISSCYVSAR